MQFSLADVGSLLLLVHLAGIAAAIHAVVHTRTSQGAVAWAVCLITMPYLTLIPYLFLGQSHFSGYIDARRSGNRQLRSLAAMPTPTTLGDMATSPSERASGASECDAPTAVAAIDAIDSGPLRAFDRLSGMPLIAGNHVRTLINGTTTFDAIFAAMATATHYVIVQFFVVRDDRLGKRLHDALRACAARGVTVYLLYDGIGSHDLSARYIRGLRAAGVHVHKFATRRFINRFQLNFRNHRKIVVIDGERAFVGGHNVGDEYLGEKAPLSPWRDTHIEICGPAVASIQFVFVEDWFWATQTVPEVTLSRTRHPANMHCQTIVSGPADDLETCSLFFVNAIQSAKRRIWLTSPYFVPDEAVFSALKLAVMRGIDVRIMIPARRDHVVVFAASTVYANEAVKAGIQMYRYQPGFLHQKVVLIDDAAAAIGSPNLDNRSFRLNFELTVLTIDRTFAAEVEAMLQADFALCKAVDVHEFQQAPAWRRAAMRIACLFSPVL